MAQETDLAATAANRYAQGAPRHDVLAGLVTWLGIFPLVALHAPLVRGLLPDSSPGVAPVAIITALVVATMTCFVGPRLTRLFARWLYPRPAGASQDPE